MLQVDTGSAWVPVEEFWDDKSQRFLREPIGTLFFVEHSVGPGAGCVRYAVTCRHVIEGFIRDSSPKKLFIRINNDDGLAEDYPSLVDEWVFGDAVDIAVTKWELPPQNQYWAYPVERGQPFGLHAGQNVFFIGMFSLVPGFVSVQAVVRAGTNARVVSEVPLRFVANPDESIFSTVHLVEMRSWGGESGSPVYIYDDRIPAEKTYAFNPGYGTGHELRPALMGALHGQFEIDRAVMKGKKQVGLAQLNSGIGVVIPTGDIIRTLQKQSLVADRHRLFEERKARAAVIPRPD